MEEVSSYWNMQLSWQIFFCAMISAFTTYLFNSAFHGFVYQGSFGAFNPEQYILFQVSARGTFRC
jgi:chloride channel 7